MIFVTVGTHPASFRRLIKKIDEIAPRLNEKVIAQTSKIDYRLKNIEHFESTQNIDQYYKKARLIITHSATSLFEIVLKYKKPVITVPRQKKYGEHINDHQVEFALFIQEKLGIPAILNVNDLTPQFLKRYNHVAKIDLSNLKRLQGFFKEILK